MQKQDLLARLQEVSQQIDDTNFELSIWKKSTLHLLRDTVGMDHHYYLAIAGLSYSEEMNYDELYPKKVKDIKGSKKRFKGITEELIELIEQDDRDEFKVGKSKTSRFQEIIGALQKHLSGRELAELKASRKGKDKRTQLLDIIKRYDVQLTQEILLEILDNDDLWLYIE